MFTRIIGRGSTLGAGSGLAGGGTDEETASIVWKRFWETEEKGATKQGRMGGGGGTG